ncbi:Piso0_002117 [Millerozyma farinosa CBS 7064]|uniref:protein-tyrosine-phosphatase n=1 Tax=Pichia sorbitophila (strain ATCC MYA-4447 / BCRC 22081 / CBS 7064 / NBRC 10061 / NRRL Y-12695) TaxID=559304 RepID=G8YBR1_PICSO|nr:Piso0_002117 [Millerozyma farinosa CBS 7064]
MSNTSIPMGLSRPAARQSDNQEDGGGFETLQEHKNGGRMFPISPDSTEAIRNECSGDGRMNYSPKHSRQPSSLSTNRNINMKSLSLNIARPNGGGSTATAGDISAATSGRPKALTLAIPSEPFGLTAATGTEQASAFPGGGRALIPSSSDSGLHYDNGRSDSQHGGLAASTNPFHKQTLRSPFMSDSTLIENFSKVKIFNEPSMYARVPEELHESNQLQAYPNGPANVLNDSIYLFSDPEGSAVDINDFDLVVNVARECRDLSQHFDTHNGQKEYLYVPWSHTSLISKELPDITRKIYEFDDSQKKHDKRKILVHCQCGVSRSACVIVAYFMFKFKIGVNEAYELLKTGTNNFSEPTNIDIKNKGYRVDACHKICPNMSLIFELMEFSDSIATK